MSEQTRTVDTLIDRYIAADSAGLTGCVSLGRASRSGRSAPMCACTRSSRRQPTIHLPREAVEAALAYYERHRAVIDARLTLHDAAFADGR